MSWSRRRRRRHHWPKLRTLKEGDIVWVEGYLSTDPILLVQRTRHVKERHGKNVYWYEGVFLSLMTGKLQTKKLSNAMTYGQVTRAFKPSESKFEEEDEDEDEVG